MADILHSVQTSASPEAILPLVSTAPGFARWWATDVTEKDGAVELAFFDRQTVYRLKLQGRPSPRRTEWLCETGAEWCDTRLIFETEPRGIGALLRFAHAGWKSQTDYFVACTTTWGELMYRLKAEAEGQSRGPLFTSEGMGY
jgi:hypothetical protein